MYRKRKDMPNLYLLLTDLFCIIVSFIFSAWIRFGGIIGDWTNSLYGFASAFLLILYVAIYYTYDTYSLVFKRGFWEEFKAVCKINGIFAVTFTLALFIFQEGAYYSRVFFISFFLMNILITYIARQYFKILLLSLYKKSSASKKLMILTTTDQVKELLLNMQKEYDWEHQITCLTLLDDNRAGEIIDGVEVKGDFHTMFETAKNQALDSVLIHLPGTYSLPVSLEEIILEFENMGITVNLSINTFGLKLHEKKFQELGGYHVLTFSSKLFSERQLRLKRFLDIAAGLVGCLITAVLTVFIAPAIMIESPGPVLFSQVRVGKNGRRFRIYKFRSMYMDAEARKKELLAQNEMSGYMFKLTNDPRITKVGSFLRKTSLDEFPQFINILRGDMSLVGTRPPTEDEFLQYENRHKRRLTLKSGLTGLWQVSGRSNITDFEEVVKLDLEYIDNWNIFIDIKIILKTLWVVLFGRGSK
jgi:exopolysaccharide biosynthesis polyprenyl glycosylphosphotransferase